MLIINPETSKTAQKSYEIARPSSVETKAEEGDKDSLDVDVAFSKVVWISNDPVSLVSSHNLIPVSFSSMSRLVSPVTHCKLQFTNLRVTIPNYKTESAIFDQNYRLMTFVVGVFNFFPKVVIKSTNCWSHVNWAVSS